MVRILDLFCGAGGAAMGLHQAFPAAEILGVDIKPQPRYPFRFFQFDVMEMSFRKGHVGIPLLGEWEFDFIWASPPCQAYSTMKHMPNATEHPELVDHVRERLICVGKPYVIENVEGAPLSIHAPMLFTRTNGIMLCGTMFGLRTDALELRRHRLFESNVPMHQPSCRHSERTVIGFYGDHARIRKRRAGSTNRGSDITGRKRKLGLVRELMGIDWMEWTESNQAIPPAYSRYIGEQVRDISHEQTDSR